MLSRFVLCPNLLTQAQSWAYISTLSDLCQEIFPHESASIFDAMFMTETEAESRRERFD
jgi:hypothetical protein